MIQILRHPDVCKAKGCQRTTLALEVAQGTFPPPVSLGARAKGWPDYEVEKIIKARIAGRTEEQIKKMVLEMVSKREELI